jgi:hypothetical protein
MRRSPHAVNATTAEDSHQASRKRWEFKGSDRDPDQLRRATMILATTKVKDLDHFLEVYGTKGADKRGSHGSKGSTVYRDPIEEDRVWAIFDWDEDGWTAFATDPETPGIMQEAGHLGRPSLGQYLGTFSA